MSRESIGSAAGQDSAVTTPPRTKGRWRKRLGIGCLTVLVILVVAGVALWFTKPWAPDVVVVEPGPGGARVSADGLLGNYYPATAADGARVPGLLVLGGSEGGLSEYADLQARELRDRGYSAFAISYFGGPGQPEAMDALPVETFDSALSYLGGQDRVDPARLGILGSSKGGEAALLVASRHPELRAVVAMVPSSVVWQGMDLQQPWRNGSIGSTWSAGGAQLPYLPYGQFRGGDLVTMYEGGLADLPEHQDAIIPVERIGAPTLLWCGEQDTLWPGCEMSRQVQERARSHGGPEVTVLAFSDAGHFSAGPPLSTDSAFYGRLGTYGGSPEGNNRARQEGWPQALDYLDQQLRR